MKVTIMRAGFSTSVQDCGRFGSRQFGVSVGGALDTHALRVANLLAGNDETAAALEITSGNVQLQFTDSRIIAWSGGEYDVSANGEPVPAGHSAVVHANEELSISGPKSGCRGWLSISGGIDVTLVLASRSTDLRAKFGGYEGRAMEDGDILPLGKNSDRADAWIHKLTERRIASWSAPHGWVSPVREHRVLHIVPGEDWSRFDDSAQHALTSQEFAVSSASDRMGVRLEGPALNRNDHMDLVSEAVAPGTIQVPPSGNPILLLGDCQTIGGYPKIASVMTVDLPIAAQLCAGARVRFALVTLANAQRLVFERQGDLERFRTGLSLQQ